MKRIINHIFQTMLLLAAVGVVAFLPEDEMGRYINPMVWTAIVGLIIGVTFFLYRKRHKGMLCLLLLGLIMSIGGGGVAWADDAENYYTNRLEGILDSYDFCKEESDFKINDAIERNEPPDKEVVRNAGKYMDTWERAKLAGKVESATVWSLWLATDKYEDAYKCAKAYLEKVAEYRQKKAQASMKTVQTLLENDKDDCWPCGIAHLMVEAVETICLAVEDTMKTAALQLLGIMLLFWILVKVLILIGQFGTASNGEFFTELLTRLAIASVAAVFLQAPMARVYELTVSPLISTTAGLTQSISGYSMEAQGVASDAAKAEKGLGGQLAGATYLTCECCSKGSDSDCNGGQLTEKKIDGESVSILDLNAKRELMCMTCSVYKQMAPLVAAGRVMIYDSLHASSMLGSAVRWVARVVSLGISDYIPYPFGMWVAGVVLVICFSILSCMIAFRCVDVFLRIGFAFVLTPFLVTAFVFPISRQYTQRGWEFLVHALLTLMSLAIGVAFIMSILMASLPISDIDTIKDMMGRTEANMGNCYASDLWQSYIGIIPGIKCNSSEGGSYYSLLIVVLVTLFGVNILNASTVIIEGLAGITCGIPSISGAAVMGAVKSAVRMAKTAGSAGKGLMPGDKVGADMKKKGDKALGKAAEVASGDVQPGFFKKMENAANSKAAKLDRGNSVQSAGKGMQATGKGMQAAGKGMEQAGDAMEKGGQAAGNALQAGGKATTKAGGGMIKAGAGMSSTGIGAIVGVPLIIAGAAVAAGGAAMQAGGMAVKAGSKIAGKATKMAGKATKVAGKATKAAGKVTEKVGKATERVGNFVQKGNRLAARGLRAVGRAAGKMQRGVDRMKQVPRNIKNRMSAMVPASVKNAAGRIGNMAKNAKKTALRKTRRMRAGMKYAKQKMDQFKKNEQGGSSGGSSGASKPSLGSRMKEAAKDKLNKGVDMALEAGDKAFASDAPQQASWSQDGAASDVGTPPPDPSQNAWTQDGSATDLGWKKPDEE